MFSSWVTDEKQPRLTESSLDLIGECSRSEATSNGAAANISGKLKDSSLRGGPGGHHIHILGVLYGSNSTGSKEKLLPSLLQINDVDSISFLFEDILLHSSLTVFRPYMGGSSYHLSDVILGDGQAIMTSGHFYF